MTLPLITTHIEDEIAAYYDSDSHTVEELIEDLEHDIIEMQIRVKYLKEQLHNTNKLKNI